MKVNLLWCPQRHKKILELSNLSSLRFWRNKGRQAVTATQKKKKKNGWDIMPENETARNDSRSHLDNVS